MDAVEQKVHELKRTIQSFFAEGTLPIVGSGLSCAEGLPSMGQLADFLSREISKNPCLFSLPIWSEISHSLALKIGLEETLLKHVPPPELESEIIRLTTEFILDKEIEVITKVIVDNKQLRFAKLLQHVTIPNNGFPVVTTNYDRLIEVACETWGILVDDFFLGHTIGCIDEIGCKHSFIREIAATGKKIRLNNAKRIKLYKPHGSLDWYAYQKGPIRCSLPLPLPRLIITPGFNKYRAGYEQPFDLHRDRGNEAIDNASRYLIIGYGFNDRHLETHLLTELKKGKPALIITHSLSPNGQNIIDEFSNTNALVFDEQGGQTGTLLLNNSKTDFYPGLNLWDLGELIKEALEP